MSEQLREVVKGVGDPSGTCKNSEDDMKQFVRTKRNVSPYLLAGLVFSLFLPEDAFATPLGVYHPKKPDFSQKEVAAWGDYFCGPTAAANSLYWLSKKYNLPGLTVNKTKVGMIEELAGYMGATKDATGNWQWPNLNAGVRDIDFITGKQNYLNKNGGGVIQQAKDGSFAVDSANTVILGPNKTKFNKIVSGTGDFPTWEWIKNERAKGEDVEIGYTYAIKKDGNWYIDGGHWEVFKGGEDQGHFVTIAGYGEPFTDLNGNDSWDTNEPFTDIVTNGLFDSDIAILHDPERDDGGIYSRSFIEEFFGDLYPVSDDFYEIAEITFSPLKVPLIKFNRQLDGYDLYGLVDIAVSQSPIPEPSTFLLLGSGLAGVIVLGRKRLFKKA